MTVLLTEHQEGQCRAVVDYQDGELGKAIMCGEPVTNCADGAKSSWCQHHHELYCFVKGKPEPKISQQRLAELGVAIVTKKSKPRASKSPWHQQQGAWIDEAKQKPKPEPKPQRAPEGFMFLTEAAQKYSIPSATLHGARFAGRVAGDALGRRTLLRVVDVEAFAAATKATVNSSAA